MSYIHVVQWVRGLTEHNPCSGQAGTRCGPGAFTPGPQRGSRKSPYPNRPWTAQRQRMVINRPMIISPKPMPKFHAPSSAIKSILSPAR